MQRNADWGGWVGVEISCSKYKRAGFIYNWKVRDFLACKFLPVFIAAVDREQLSLKRQVLVDLRLPRWQFYYLAALYQSLASERAMLASVSEDPNQKVQDPEPLGEPLIIRRDDGYDDYHDGVFRSMFRETVAWQLDTHLTNPTSHYTERDVGLNGKLASTVCTTGAIYKEKCIIHNLDVLEFFTRDGTNNFLLAKDLHLGSSKISDAVLKEFDLDYRDYVARTAAHHRLEQSYLILSAATELFPCFEKTVERLQSDLLVPDQPAELYSDLSLIDVWTADGNWQRLDYFSYKQEISDHNIACLQLHKRAKITIFLSILHYAGFNEIRGAVFAKHGISSEEFYGLKNDIKVLRLRSLYLSIVQKVF